MSLHQYHITVSENNPTENETIEFDLDSHDDLHEIIERAIQLNAFDQVQTKAFAIGIKLLGSVLLQNKNHPLLAEFTLHFGELMRTIKGKSKG